MRTFFSLCIVALVMQQAVAPPTKNKNDIEEDKDGKNEVEEKEDMEDVMEYHRYLKEVVQALESDDEFRKKLEKAEEVDIRTGKIAHELEFVNHQVRTKLDELKRRELERLRHLAMREYQLENGLDPGHLKIAEHLDHANPHTFEIDDLKKLIAKTTEDLAEADRKRREEFKQYEMQKKFEQEEKMKGMDEEKKKKYKEEVHEMEEKHKKHKPLHHPGSKQQLEEVWEKQDHMDSQDFDPKTFFYLHDLDGNGVWDQDEVKALFLKELDKLYAQGAPEDDLRERAEEMERMREHVFNEADLNKDGLISYHEFLEQTKRPEFTKDPGWQGLDEQQIYSQQEYEAFERQRQHEIEKLIAQGVFPPQYANAPMGQGVPPHDFMPPVAQGYHPMEGQVPQQQFQGQVPQHQQQQFQGQVPHQQQQFQGQVPHQQQQFQGQVPQQQFQGQVPQQQFQGQVPPQQQQQFQGQVPQQQQQRFQGQVPQQQQQQFQGQVPQPRQPQGQVVQQQQQAQVQVPQQQVNQGQQPVAKQEPVPQEVPKPAQQQQNIPQQQQNVPAQQQQQNTVRNSQNDIPDVKKV